MIKKLIAGLLMLVVAVIVYLCGQEYVAIIMAILICGIIVLLIIYEVKKSKSDDGKIKYEYVKRERVVSVPESAFYDILVSIIPNKRYKVLEQICLSSVIDKKNASFRNELFRMIDYCVVDKNTYEPLLLIELNDASHKRTDRKMRDQKVYEIAQSAKLPIMYVQQAMASDIHYVKSEIKKFIKI